MGNGDRRLRTLLIAALALGVIGCNDARGPRRRRRRPSSRSSRWSSATCRSPSSTWGRSAWSVSAGNISTLPRRAPSGCLPAPDAICHSQAPPPRSPSRADATESLSSTRRMACCTRRSGCSSIWPSRVQLRPAGRVNVRAPRVAFATMACWERCRNRLSSYSLTLPFTPRIRRSSGKARS